MSEVDVAYRRLIETRGDDHAAMTALYRHLLHSANVAQRRLSAYALEPGDIASSVGLWLLEQAVLGADPCKSNVAGYLARTVHNRFVDDLEALNTARKATISSEHSHDGNGPKLIDTVDSALAVGLTTGSPELPPPEEEDLDPEIGRKRFLEAMDVVQAEALSILHPRYVDDKRRDYAWATGLAVHIRSTDDYLAAQPDSRVNLAPEARKIALAAFYKRMERARKELIEALNRLATKDTDRSRVWHRLRGVISKSAVRPGSGTGRT